MIDQFSFRFEFDRIAIKMSKLSFVILTVFVIAVVTAQQVVRENNNNDGSGNFRFTYGSSINWIFIKI